MACSQVDPVLGEGQRVRLLDQFVVAKQKKGPFFFSGTKNPSGGIATCVTILKIVFPLQALHCCFTNELNFFPHFLFDRELLGPKQKKSRFLKK
jgi:hypothetical protein